jgi:hypothetical protein
LLNKIGVLKMFGKSKKKDFFLEIDESQEAAAPAQAETTEASKAEAAPVQAEVAPETKPEAKQQAAPKKAKKTSIKEKKQTSSAPAAPATVKPAPVAAKVVEPTQVNFATEYILPVFTSGPRRRPGPSLNPFLSMASEMKVPTSAK